MAFLPTLAIGLANDHSVLSATERAIAFAESGRQPVEGSYFEISAGEYTSREASAADMLTLLRDFRERLMINGDMSPEASGGEPGLLFGFGATSLQLPHEECAPVMTHASMFSPTHKPRPLLHRIDGGVGTGEVICGANSGARLSVLIDASEALETCSSCSWTTAQVWSDGSTGRHTNEFRYLAHSGTGAVKGSSGCYSIGCWASVTFMGAQATTEAYRGPPIPGIELLRVPPDLDWIPTER